MNKKRFSFRIYYFSRIHELEVTETCRTKPMTEPDFKKLLAKRLKDIDQEYGFEILNSHGYSEAKSK